MIRSYSMPNTKSIQKKGRDHARLWNRGG